jgi:HK97 family phage major capsid protein
MKNQRDNIRVLFQHGRDPQVGDKPLGPIADLREDADGAYYEVPLLDTTYNRDLIPGLQANLYGASFKFSVVQDDFDPKPKRSTHNPDALPERTIREARLFEFGPVTFPAYPGATAGVRSITTADLDAAVAPHELTEALPDAGPEALPHSDEGTREAVEPTIPDAPPKETPPMDLTQYPTPDDMTARITELDAEIKRAANLPGVLPEAEQLAFDERVNERTALIEAHRIKVHNLAQVHDAPEPNREPGYSAPNIIRAVDEGSIYDVPRMRREARSEAQLSTQLRDNSMRAIEGATFGNARFPRQSGQSDVATLLAGKDQCEPDEVAKRVLYTGKPAYRRAFHKFLLGQTLTAEEQVAYEEARAALVTLSNTAVPFDLDTTMQINTAGAVNPYRDAFRVVKTTSNDWRPMVSSGMVAVYVGEATAGSEAAPAFTAPTRLIQKAHTVAKFSTEIQSDYPGLEAELAREISDAKDVLESVQFTTGAGSTIYPQGIFTFWASNFKDTTTTLVIVPADLYRIEAWMGPRYRANSVWLGSPYFYSLVRGIDTAGGAGLWVDNLTQGGAVGNLSNNGRLGNLTGHPAYEVAGLPATMATTEIVAGLFNTERWVVIDRIGMNLELIPNFVDTTTGYPTGERMVYAWWRNTACGIGTATLTVGGAGVLFRGK